VFGVGDVRVWDLENPISKVAVESWGKLREIELVNLFSGVCSVLMIAMNK